VLTRYLQALEAFPAQHVIRITADNPLSDPELLDLNAQNFLEKGLDYAYMKNVPAGTACDIFRTDVLRYIDERTQNPYHREHINAYILDHQDRFRLEFFDQVPNCYHRPELSFTVDTRKDFEWVQSLFFKTKQRNVISLEEMITLADIGLEHNVD
jgi:spore coat polysaccharide biosynthesis protein SpsF